jgi:hypothetical protein
MVQGPAAGTHSLSDASSLINCLCEVFESLANGINPHTNASQDPQCIRFFDRKVGSLKGRAVIMALRGPQLPTPTPTAGLLLGAW